MIEHLKKFNPEANIYFTPDPDLNSKEGYPYVEINAITELQLRGLLHKAGSPVVAPDEY